MRSSRPPARLSAETASKASTCPGAERRPCRRRAAADARPGVDWGVTLGAPTGRDTGDRGVGKLSSSPREPAGQLDIGVEASRVQARVEVAVLDGAAATVMLPSD